MIKSLLLFFFFLTCSFSFSQQVYRNVGVDYAPGNEIRTSSLLWQETLWKGNFAILSGFRLSAFDNTSITSLNQQDLESKIRVFQASLPVGLQVGGKWFFAGANTDLLGLSLNRNLNKIPDTNTSLFSIPLLKNTNGLSQVYFGFNIGESLSLRTGLAQSRISLKPLEGVVRETATSIFFGIQLNTEK